MNANTHFEAPPAARNSMPDTKAEPASSLAPAFVAFTEELANELGSVRSLVDRDVFSGGDHTEVARRFYPAFAAWLDDRIGELSSLCEPFGVEERATHGRWFRAKMRPFTEQSVFLARANARPRGYAGDSELMRMLYDDELRGSTAFGCLLHRHPIRTAAGDAVRNRLDLVADLVREQPHSSGAPLRVMSLACGPAREIRKIVTSGSDAEDLELVLADQDEHALAEAREEVRYVERSIGRPLRATTKNLSVRDILRGGSEAQGLGRFDVIYSLGLFDYLTRPVAKTLVEKLVGMLAPGGKLVVGNFHVGCTTRTYLELWADWPLHYRTEGDLLELSDDVDVAERKVAFESTGSQIFLFLTKR